MNDKTESRYTVHKVTVSYPYSGRAQVAQPSNEINWGKSVSAVVVQKMIGGWEGRITAVFALSPGDLSLHSR